MLVHVGDDVRESLLADMDPDEIVAAVEDLDIDDLADLVEDLPDTVIDEVLKSMDRENRERLEQVLSYDGGHRRPPDEPGRGDGARRHHRRRRAALPAPARRTARAHRPSVRRQPPPPVPGPHRAAVAADPRRRHADQPADRRRAAGDRRRRIRRRKSRASSPTTTGSRAPVVDDNNILLGRITIDDVVDIIREQAEHQALSAAGLDEDEDLFSPVPRACAAPRGVARHQPAARRSSPSCVVGSFEGTIEQDRRAGRADADRRRHGRQRRHAGAGADGARPRARPGRRVERRAAAVQGSARGADQRRACWASCSASSSFAVVPRPPAVAGDRRGDDHQPAARPRSPACWCR